jgi:hypothetical protein
MDESRVCGWRDHGGEDDDEELFALESGDEGGLVFVINGAGLYAGRERVGAADAGQGRDSVLLSFEELAADVAAESAGRLEERCLSVTR